MNTVFTGIWWLDQNGLSNVVGTMGADCSEKQAELIVSLVKPAGRVWIMPDGSVPGKQTDAGLRFAQSLLLQIAPHRAIRWVKLAERQQPTDWSAQQLKDRFNF